MSEAVAPAAPAQATAPTEGQAAPPEVDPYAEFDAVLKTKPLKYKAGGRERSVASMKELVRKAEQADGLMSRAQDVAEREAKASAVLERDSRLKAAKTPKERIAILRELAGDGFDEAAEESVLERIEREKSMSGLSATERQARQRAEELEAKVAEYEAEKQRASEEQQRQAEEAELGELRQSLAGTVVKALVAAKLPKEAAPDAGRRLAVLMARAQSLGHDLTPDELAGEAVKWAGEDFRGYTAGLEGDSLIDFLGEAVVRKASKAWLARVQSGSASRGVLPPAQVQSAQPQGERPRESAAAAWRALEKGLLK
jgi:hypothetical protein